MMWWAGLRNLRPFRRGRPLPELKSGDLVAILSAGAYGAVMASDYNARPRLAKSWFMASNGASYGPGRPMPISSPRTDIPDWLAG
jgi:diaminopimelate decarboxylase